MKYKIHLLTYIIGIASITWIAMSIWRWWFQYPDLSQMVLGILIGIIGLGGAIINNWMRNMEDIINLDRDYFNSRYDVLYDEIQEGKNVKHSSS